MVDLHKDLLELEKKNYLNSIKDVDEKVLKKLEEEFEIKYAHEALKSKGKNVITLMNVV